MMELAAMPKYEAYKDSEVEWLGVIPIHWDLTRLATRFEERRTKVSDKDFAALSVTKNGVVPQLSNAAKSNDGDNRKLVKKGDFVINSRSDRKGSSGVASRDGSVSLIYIVLEPKSIAPSYCEYLLKSYNFIEEFYRMGHGIVADLWSTRYDEMKAVIIGIPPLKEQFAIANFLDKKTAQIDEAIAIKQKQIELLKERKQIIIQKAVTQGLESNVPMRDSGVEWIGKIPEHWNVNKLKHYIQTLESGVSVNASESESALSNEIGVLKTSAVYKYKFDPIENKKVFKNELNRVSCSVKKGSIIISRMNAPELVGASGYVEQDYPNLFLPDRLWQATFSNTSRSLPKYLSIVLTTKGFRGVIESIATGSSPSMKNISKGDLLNTKIAIPPTPQISIIVKHVERLSIKVDQTINIQQTQINKLKEYKTTLINSTVTGKIKVPMPVNQEG